MPDAPAPALPDALRLRGVQLAVADLARSVAFYEGALGLQVHGAEGSIARLGAGGEDLVVLREERGARHAGRHAGLYHYALLSDSREELAHALLRLVATRTPIQGASDHGVSEAIYLADPDGNGIELYADRPRAAWPPADPGARVGMYTIALDTDDLLAQAGVGPDSAVEPRRHAGGGLVLGHVHLHVNDLAAASAFYRDALGFELMVGLGSADFLAAGGYHHHLGVNVWRGRGIPAAPEHGVVGLDDWQIMLPGADDVAAARARLDAAGAATTDREGGFTARDPAGIPVSVVAATI